MFLTIRSIFGFLWCGFKLSFDFFVAIPVAIWIGVEVANEQRSYWKHYLRIRLWWLLTLFASFLVIRAMIGLFWGIGAGLRNELITGLDLATASGLAVYLLVRWRLTWQEK